MKTFCTTPEQEEKLKKIYTQKVKEKQAELDAKAKEEKEKNPRYIPKYTAKAYVDEEPRTFHVSKTGITMDNEPTSLRQVKGGGVYYPDQKFQEGVEAFVQKHPEYTITFYITSKYGPTIDYTGDGYVCFLQAATGEQLFVEDPDAYEIAVL